MCVRKATTNGNEKMGLKDLEKKRTATSTIPLRNVCLAVSYFTDTGWFLKSCSIKVKEKCTEN